MTEMGIKRDKGFKGHVEGSAERGKKDGKQQAKY